MGVFTQSISAADVLAGLTTDSTKWAGLELARLGAAESFGELTFWGAPLNASATTSASNTSMGSIALPNLTGLTIKAAYAVLLWKFVMDTSGVNNGNVAGMTLQVDTGSAGWLTGYTFGSAEIKILANRDFQALGIAQGTVDVKAKVAFNATTDFQIGGYESSQNDLAVRGFQAGIRVII